MVTAIGWQYRRMEAKRIGGLKLGGWEDGS